MKKPLFSTPLGLLFNISTWASLGMILFNTGSSSSQSISAGQNHSLAVCSNNSAQSWGWNSYNQLGNGSTISSATPVQINNLTGVLAVASGIRHNLALKNNGQVYAWGDNSWGQLGTGNNLPSSVPVQVTALNNIIAVSTGAHSSYALKNDGTLWAFGWNLFGQLGNGSNTDSNVPVQVTGLTGIISIQAGSFFVLALKNDGTVWSWGSNTSGQLGYGNFNDSNIPLQVSNLTGVSQLAAGYSFSLALKTDGSVWGFGDNSDGQLGNGTFAVSNIPVQASISGVTKIACGYRHALAIQNNGSVMSWGLNNLGQLGNGSTSFNSNIPVQVSGNLTGSIQIAAGESHSMILLNNGTLWTFGNNFYGQLGSNTLVNSNIPVQVINLCQVLTTVSETVIDIDPIIVYPNPAIRTLIIEKADGIENNPEIYSLSGSRMNTNIETVSENKIVMDISHLSAGSYAVFLTRKSTVMRRKFLVVK